MLKRCLVLISMVFISVVLFSGGAFAFNFETLPSGISDVVSDGWTVIKTGETTNGIVYVISQYNTNSGYQPVTRIVGFSKTEGNIAYDVQYTQSCYTKGISFKSVDYYYIITKDGAQGKIRKIDLKTGGISSTLAGSIDGGGDAIYTPPVESVSSGGWTAQTLTAAGNTVKYITVSSTDKVYVLAKEPTNNNNRILKWNGSNWERAFQTTFPGTDATSEPQGFCAPTDAVFYSAYPGNIYRTEVVVDGIHTKINSGTLAGTVAFMSPGVNAKDMILVYCDTNLRGYLSYYLYASNTFNALLANSDFNTTTYNLTWLPNTVKASFSFWNGNFGILAIHDNGWASWVHMPTKAWQQTMNNYNERLEGTYNNRYIKSQTSYNSIIGAFGVRTINSWVVTKKTITDRDYSHVYVNSSTGYTDTDNYSPNMVYSMLSPVFPSYWVQQATYIENITTDTGTGTGTGGSGSGGDTTSGSVTSTSVFRVVKDADFIEYVYDDLVTTATTVEGVTATPVAVTGDATKKYTKLTGKFTTIADATNPSKAVVIGGKLLIFKIITPPANSQTVTLQLTN